MVLLLVVRQFFYGRFASLNDRPNFSFSKVDSVQLNLLGVFRTVYFKWRENGFGNMQINFNRDTCISYMLYLINIVTYIFS